MPIVRIDIQAGKSTAYKREILHSVRSAIVDSLGVPDDRVMQRIIETPSDDIDAPDVRSDRLTIIEVSMLPGRDAKMKQALYAAIVAALGETPGIHQHDITVLVNDPSAECFAIGGVMQCTLSVEAEPEAVENLAADEDEEVVTAEPDDEPAIEPGEEPAVEPEPDEAPAAVPDAEEEPDAEEADA